MAEQPREVVDQACWRSILAGRNYIVRNRLPLGRISHLALEPSGIQPVKLVHAFLLLRAEASARIAA